MTPSHSTHATPAPTSMLVLVTGITGHQGSYVARHLLERGHRIRALVRDPKSPRLADFSAKGIELATGSFDAPETIVKAARGVDAMFLMGTRSTSGPGEAAQGIAAVDAAKAAEVPWLIYSSVGSADRATGIPHFEAKFAVEEHLRGAGVRYAVSAPTAFMENFTFPYQLPGLRQGRLGGGTSPARGVQMVALDDLGAFVTLLLENPTLFAGRRTEVASDLVSQAEAARVLTELSGRKIDYQRIPPEALRAQNPDSAKMLEWFERDGYKADIEGLRREYPQVGWQRFGEWAAGQDWVRLLA